MVGWNPGTGHSIIIGKDVILGMGKDSILSNELVSTLNQKNVYFCIKRVVISTGSNLLQLVRQCSFGARGRLSN
jgi:hypothetical protein